MTYIPQKEIFTKNRIVPMVCLYARCSHISRSEPRVTVCHVKRDLYTPKRDLYTPKRDLWCNRRAILVATWKCVAACCSVKETYTHPKETFGAIDVQDQYPLGSVLQHVAVCCSVLQCVAVCCSVFPLGVSRDGKSISRRATVLQRAAVCCSVLQCVAVRCTILPHVTARRFLGMMVQRTATHCNTLQRAAPL